MQSLTVVLIPGMLSDAWIFHAQIEALRARGAIHVPDLTSASSLTDMAHKVLDETSGPLAVAGHSMGGRVAFEMVRIAPERIDRLAGISTGLDSPHPAEPEKRAKLVEIARTQGMEALAAQVLVPTMHPDSARDQRLVRELTQMVARATPEIFERQQNALLGRPDPAASIGDVRCPTAFICGRDDRWTPPKQHEALHALVPDSTLTLVGTCGHLPLVEQPHVVNAVLEAWLDR